MDDNERQNRIEEWVKEMISLQGSGDIEGNHSDADDLLCKALSALGYESLVEEYKKVSKWYS